MLSNIKALIVILGFGLIVLRLMRDGLIPLIPLAEQKRLEQLFVVICASSFLLPSFWLYAAVLVGMLRKHAHPPAGDSLSAWRATLWMWLLMVVPAITVYVPGMGIIGYFFEISHVRLLGFVLLFGALFVVRSAKMGVGTHPVDLCVLAYLGFEAAILMLLYDTTFTDWIRITFVAFTDVWLPYWAMSRAFDRPDQIKRALAALTVMCIIMGGLGMFEISRSWALFEGVENIWGEDWSLSIFLMRDGYLRAQTSTGHSLVFAYCCAVCLGLWVWLQNSVANKRSVWLGFFLLAGGLGASLSRGTWIATVFYMGVLALLSRKPARNLTLMTGVSVVAVLILIAAVPSFAELVNKMIGAGGGGGTESVDDEKEYRQALFETCIALIAQSPWFGVPNAFAYMEHLRQGQGIIDVVNSYLAIALSYGLAGLTPFVLMFLINIWRMWTLRSALGMNHEGGQAATVMIAVMVGVMVIIFSASSISTIPYIYFALSGIMVSIDRIYRPVPAPRTLARQRRQT